MCLAQAWFYLLFVKSLVFSSFFSEAVWGAWSTRVAGDLSSRAGFRGGRYLDFRGSLKLLSSPHLRGGDEGLLRGILSGGVWNGFLLGFVKGEIVPCRFCGGPDSDGHLFWECPHPPLVHIRESVEFRDLLLREKSSWPRCLLWHGWLPALACTGGASPWAASADDVACSRLERLLGSYSEGVCREWVPPDHFVDDVVSSNECILHLIFTNILRYTNGYGKLRTSSRTT